MRSIKHETKRQKRSPTYNQSEDVLKNEDFMSGFDNWMELFSTFVHEKGKVQTNKYRAYGFQPPSHF